MKKELKTTAMFKIVMTLKNGAHKILRMTIDKVAMLNAAIRQAKEYGMINNRYRDFLTAIGVELSKFHSCKVINERTGELFLAL